jgi:hypothetical protein
METRSSAAGALYRMALTTKVRPEDPVTYEDVTAGRRTREEFNRFYMTTLFQNSCEDCLMRTIDDNDE